MEINMYSYLLLGLMLFIIGFAGSVLAKHVLKVLIAIEIMLTGVNINLITFASYCDNVSYNGYIMVLFYTGIGAVELAVAFYIFYLMFQKKKSDNIESYSEL